MNQRLAKIKHTHPCGFRSGVFGEIIGVVFCKPEDREERLCYKVMYEDGIIDYLPLSDKDYYIIE